MIRPADVWAGDICPWEMNFDESVTPDYAIFMKRRARLCKSPVSAIERIA
ncbi:MAG: hypothetical protein JSR95_04425 [Proteobacteria bacterium]|nr:hypothetical protein [Pseudomonadota bacterium]